MSASARYRLPEKECQVARGSADATALAFISCGLALETAFSQPTPSSVSRPEKRWHELALARVAGSCCTESMHTAATLGGDFTFLANVGSAGGSRQMSPLFAATAATSSSSSAAAAAAASSPPTPSAWYGAANAMSQDPRLSNGYNEYGCCLYHSPLCGCWLNSRQSERRVKIWFQNHRYKCRRAHKEKENVNQPFDSTLGLSGSGDDQRDGASSPSCTCSDIESKDGSSRQPSDGPSGIDDPQLSVSDQNAMSADLATQDPSKPPLQAGERRLVDFTDDSAVTMRNLALAGSEFSQTGFHSSLTEPFPRLLDYQHARPDFSERDQFFSSLQGCERPGASRLLSTMNPYPYMSFMTGYNPLHSFANVPKDSYMMAQRPCVEDRLRELPADMYRQYLNCTSGSPATVPPVKGIVTADNFESQLSMDLAQPGRLAVAASLLGASMSGENPYPSPSTSSPSSTAYVGSAAASSTGNLSLQIPAYSHSPVSTGLNISKPEEGDTAEQKSPQSAFCKSSFGEAACGEFASTARYLAIVKSESELMKGIAAVAAAAVAGVSPEDAKWPMYESGAVTTDLPRDHVAMGDISSTASKAQVFSSTSASPGHLAVSFPSAEGSD
nr:unnamed protein product [Spirometra erinaceieuropaei]